MPQLKHFAEIRQFSDIILEVRYRWDYKGKDAAGNPIYEHTEPYPKLQYRGTTKLHGTNNAFIYNPMEKDKLHYQTRDMLMSFHERDQYGFYNWATQNHIDIHELCKTIPNPDLKPVYVYGEWCGKDILGGTAVAQAENFFCILAVKVGDNRISNEELKLLVNTDLRILNIEMAIAYLIEIDFNLEEAEMEKSEGYQRMVALTEATVNECPFALDVLGIQGNGEGLVWKCYEPGFTESKFWFKTKNKKHKLVQSKKTVEISPEKLANALEFAKAVVSENRLEQGYRIAILDAKLPEAITSLGKFLIWINQDILKEENNRLEASGMTWKDVAPSVSRIAKEWYGKKIPQK